jgi:hypothetical protein
VQEMRRDGRQAVRTRSAPRYHNAPSNITVLVKPPTGDCKFKGRAHNSAAWGDQPTGPNKPGQTRYER